MKNIDKKIECEITIIVVDENGFPSLVPFNVKIEGDEFLREYKNVRKVYEEIPWIDASEKLLVYIYPYPKGQDIIVEFVITKYKVSVNVQYIYYTIEKPSNPMGLYLCYSDILFYPVLIHI